MAESHRLVNPRKIYVKDLNDNLTCSLCGGYLIDATTVVDCSHTFCRACIVRHFESSRLCPNCGSLVHKSKPLSKLRSDTTLQSLIYKVIPSLYNKELQRRADFYHSTGFRSNSACSDDSVLGDRSLDSEEWVISNVGDPSLYFSPDDSISLSVEYYRPEMVENSETTPNKSETTQTDSLISDKKCAPENNEVNGSDAPSLISDEKKSDDGQNSNSDLKNDCTPNTEQNDKISCVIGSDDNTSGFIQNEMSHKRFLQCPAAVRMSHLMKFLRMKFALSNEHRVDIIYKGEVLPPYLSLMDVAYSFKWKRDSPMRFFYLIYIPVPTSVVPPQQQTTSITTTPLIPPLKIEISNNIKVDTKNLALSTDDCDTTPEIKVNSETEDLKKEDNNNLKTNSKSVKFSDKPTNSDVKSYQKSVKFNDFKTTNYAYKVKTNDSIKDVAAENCVYDYAEPDKDEIKAFAERRDREWALQKYQDSQFHVSKKRKKNKHSKNEFMHKKRKLHAEITNEISSKSDDSLKLKVKLSVANGHKHKHRNSNSNVEQPKIQELSPKERLLQMRQVRHKHISPQGTEEKPSLKVVLNSEKSESAENTERSKPEVVKQPDQINNEIVSKVEIAQKSEQVVKQESVSKTPERVTKQTEPPPQPQRTPPEILSTGKTLRSDFSFKTSLSKDICNKYVRVNLEKCAENKTAQKKSPVNNSGIKTIENKLDDKVVKNDLNNKTEIIPIENKQSQNNKVPINNTNSKVIESKMYSNKIAIENSKLNNANHTINDKISNKLIEDKKVISNIKPGDENKKKISDNFTVTPNKSAENNKQQNNKIDATKLVPKPTESKTIDESKTIENKLNNITSQSSLVTKNFTVSKVETGIKRKLDAAESSNDKRPSLEITVINVVSRPQTSTIQTNPIQSKPKINNQITKSLSITPEGPPVKKIRPPPLTIPLGRIQKANSLKANTEKCDISGALDLSSKPKTHKPDVKINNDFRSHSASPKPKIQDQIQSLIRPKTPIKTQDVKNDNLKNRPNISNLQMLSESAVQVQIREMMVKGSPISTIPNLNKKIPSPQNLVKSDFLPKPNFPQKTPNLIPKTVNNQMPKSLNNFPPKSPQFISKNLQKIPKLNEINRSQFCRVNPSAQIRSPRPAGQNQTVRNIPNPSLLVRQQNQNRINSLNTTVSQNQDNSNKAQDTIKIKPESETDRKTEKNSEPPPLKPIESFKK